ncbi:MAG: CBS domain-containing protein [bacterium]|nr:CBS domain-containing protein [bacterium]
MNSKLICAEDIMTRDVITARSDMSVKEVATLLVKYQISGLPVVDSADRLVGIVTEADLVHQETNLHLPSVLTILDSFLVLETPKHFEEKLRKMVADKVEDIMTRKVITVSPQATVAEVATIMSQKRIHLLPVVSSQKLVGIISKADVVRFMAGSQ